MARLTNYRSTATDNLTTLHLRDLIGADIVMASPTSLQLHSAADLLHVTFTGVGLTYDRNQQLTGGTVTAIEYSSTNLRFDITGVSISGAQAMNWLLTDATQTAFSTILSGNDTLFAQSGPAVLHGYDGNDFLGGFGGADTFFGGSGNDTIVAVNAGQSGTAPHFLRGEAGDDSLSGSAGFDDMHGNMGSDSLYGLAGADWVVGGQNDDLLYGDGQKVLYGGTPAMLDGGDQVYGNMGNDTCFGGDGDDTMRGGQDNDTMAGEAGNDWISGDRGDDTMSGGAGGDTFYVFAGSGRDRIVDFSVAQGDRIQFEPGLNPVVQQQGDDTVISFGAGDQITLVGVQSSSLVGAWSFIGAS